MEWYIYVIWIAFGIIMIATGLAYLYYLLGIEDLVNKYKNKDIRYD